ncbi:sulfite exporter TauE/SafE family protein [Sphingomonas crocodyli]|uniref:Probable membrane transporter protein n=1 Tax=Sphingomonas crocodyli TaxID=1979270 RepID=A0A437MBG3_9SPHN|nr:sulfite exporter TauE/SafE family protein [Sphingomonas crocodyli]
MHQPAFWVLGLIAVTIIGLAKGGFIGFGILGTPLLALAIPPVQAAAIILPLLLVQDAVGIWSFRKTWDAYVLKVMLPGGIVGIAIGYTFAASLPDSWVLGALGILSIVFGAYRLWIERGGRAAPAVEWPAWAGFLCGTASGLSSQIAHAGQPPFQLWAMPRRMPRDVYVGTSSIFFGAMNWIKVPAYAALGAFTPSNLIASAALLPVAILSTLLGVRLVRRIRTEGFYRIAYALLLLVGVVLLRNAVAG